MFYSGIPGHESEKWMVALTRDETRLADHFVWVVIPTFRRPTMLTRTLASLVEQTHLPRHVVVVDNEASSQNERMVAEFDRCHEDLRIQYVASEENVGPAGATALGMTIASAESSSDGWLLRLDDDRPLQRPNQLEDLVRLSHEALRLNPRVGGVGYAGARFDFRTGRLVKPPNKADGHDFVEVDYLASGRFPMFRMSAIREVGPFQGNLFFGFSEVEYGLRLRHAGYVLYRIDRGRNTRTTSKSSWRVAAPSWRRYYSLRNEIAVLRQYKNHRLAAKVSLRVLVKPVLNLPLHPKVAAGALRQNVLAVSHGWKGRLGRTVDPVDWIDAEAELPST
jgi:rhamnopyranosyl-N-acetylglucosaminyl-diphospho-decaprenol beta-1,3/1,4-galactofuranosyltransferase